MEFLDELGKQEVQQKKRRDKKLIVVDPEAASRYHSRCDQGNGETPSEGVIGTV